MSIGDDAIRELDEVLAAFGCRATFDRHRNVNDPCYRCGTTETERSLHEVGRYSRPMGGGLRVGDAIKRPLCSACVTETETA